MRLRRSRPVPATIPVNPRLEEMVDVARQVRALADRLIATAQAVREEVDGDNADQPRT